MNKVILCGNLTRDPEMKYTPNGHPVVHTGMATNERWRDKNGEQKERVTFHNLQIWGKKRGETFAQYMTKGQKVLVTGRINTDRVEKDGRTTYYTKVVVDDFEFVSPKRDVGPRSAALPGPESTWATPAPSTGADPNAFQPVTSDSPQESVSSADWHPPPSEDDFPGGSSDDGGWDLPTPTANPGADVADDLEWV